MDRVVGSCGTVISASNLLSSKRVEPGVVLTVARKIRRRARSCASNLDQQLYRNCDDRQIHISGRLP